MSHKLKYRCHWNPPPPTSTKPPNHQNHQQPPTKTTPATNRTRWPFQLRNRGLAVSRSRGLAVSRSRLRLLLQHDAGLAVPPLHCHPEGLLPRVVQAGLEHVGDHLNHSLRHWSTFFFCPTSTKNANKNTCLPLPPKKTPIPVSAPPASSEAPHTRGTAPRPRPASPRPGPPTARGPGRSCRASSCGRSPQPSRRRSPTNGPRGGEGPASGLPVSEPMSEPQKPMFVARFVSG